MPQSVAVKIHGRGKRSQPMKVATAERHGIIDGEAERCVAKMVLRRCCRHLRRSPRLSDSRYTGHPDVQDPHLVVGRQEVPCIY